MRTPKERVGKGTNCKTVASNVVRKDGKASKRVRILGRGVRQACAVRVEFDHLGGEVNSCTSKLAPLDMAVEFWVVELGRWKQVRRENFVQVMGGWQRHIDAHWQTLT